jgi:hypothetical protein
LNVVLLFTSSLHPALLVRNLGSSVCAGMNWTKKVRSPAKVDLWNSTDGLQNFCSLALNRQGLLPEAVARPVLHGFSLAIAGRFCQKECQRFMTLPPSDFDEIHAVFLQPRLVSG